MLFLCSARHFGTSKTILIWMGIFVFVSQNVQNKLGHPKLIAHGQIR